MFPFAIFGALMMMNNNNMRLQREIKKGWGREKEKRENKIFNEIKQFEESNFNVIIK